MLRFLFSRFWDLVPCFGIGPIDRAICRAAECFPDGWYDQNDNPSVTETLRDRLQRDMPMDSDLAMEMLGNPVIWYDAARLTVDQFADQYLMVPLPVCQYVWSHVRANRSLQLT